MSFLEVLLTLLLSSVGPFPCGAAGESPRWMSWVGGALVVGSLIVLMAVLAAR